MSRFINLVIKDIFLMFLTFRGYKLRGEGLIGDVTHFGEKKVYQENSR